MGHILFGAPSLAHYHLHDRVARSLTERGHRVTVLAGDPETFEIFSTEGFATWALRPGRAVPTTAPLAELAAVDCLLQGQNPPGGRRLRKATARLRRRLGPLRRLLFADRPDLVLLHNGRRGIHRLIQFAAREAGARVLHTGNGLLPHTLQWDDEGIDGDSTAARRPALYYRSVDRNPRLVATTAAAWLAELAPPGVPPARRNHRWRDRLASALPGDRWPASSISATDRSTLPPPPDSPLIAVLLQSPGSPRLTLDAPPGADPIALALEVARAAPRLGEGIGVTAIAPTEGVEPSRLRLLEDAGIDVRPAHAAGSVLAVAMAAVTINHPLGIGALLTGTPLVHVGRTPYGVAGVSVRSRTGDIETGLRRALALDNETLRERFLTEYLTADHVWCSPVNPDLHGLRGLVMGIEERLIEPAPLATSGSYSPGPVWPLSAR